MFLLIVVNCCINVILIYTTAAESRILHYLTYPSHRNGFRFMKCILKFGDTAQRSRKKISNPTFERITNDKAKNICPCKGK